MEKMAGLFWLGVETTTLLNLWLDISVHCQLDGAVFQRLHSDLAALGFVRTWQQCTVKMKNLTAICMKIVGLNQRTGQGRADFSYYAIP